MGSLDDQNLYNLHESITQAFYYNSQPNYQKICEVLNGMSMPDMLDELWRVKMMGKLDGVEFFVPRATNVNITRLRAAIGAVQPQAPGDFDSLLRMLPVDQQRAIKSVRMVTQAPQPMSPSSWSKYYWSVRCIPAPTPGSQKDSKGSGDSGDTDGKKGDDDEAHLAADVASSITANAPKGKSPITVQATVIFRNLDARKLSLGNGDEIAILHEPNISVQLSPDPNNKAVAQAAVTLFNYHLKRNWGLLKPDLEFSIAADGTVTSPGGAPGGGAQAQIELHITSTISVTASSALSFGPGRKPGDAPDYGSYHTGNRDVDVSFAPFMVGITGHWDPP